MFIANRRYAISRAAPRHRGMTLIELMVALAIGSFLMIGAVTVFMQSRTTFRINEAVARLQENGRFVLNTIEPDIRMAHYFGLTSRSSKVDGRATETEAVAFVPLVDDCGVNWSVDLADEVEGWNGTGGWQWTCAPNGTYQPASDTFVIRRVTEDPVPALVANTLYVQSARYQNSQLFTGTVIPPDYLASTSQTHQLVVNGYYVSQNSSLDTAGNPVPSLRRKRLVGLRVLDEEVLPGVEDMQVQFGVDTDVPGAVNRGVIDRYLNPRDPIINPLNAAFNPDAQILSVRIWLRLRSERTERGHTDTNAYVYADQNVAAPNDNYRRIVVSKTIYLRNARPAS
jgi:type IV pilus assembly protein PilW